MSKRPRAKPAAPAKEKPFPARRHHVLVLVALSVIVAVAYSNSFSSGFILDNKGLLLDPRIRAATADNLALILRHTYWWPNGEAGLYRPFTTLSYLFNYALLGDAADSAGYHWLNLWLHLANAGLAYALVWTLIRRFWPAAFAAALWAAHPVLTESVTNIVGRADLLAAVAVLGGLCIYIKFPPGGVWAAALALVTAIGVFSKESAVMLLPIALLYESLERRQWRRAWLGCAALALPIGWMLYQRSAVLAASARAEFPFTDNPIAGASWWIGRLTALKIIPGYLWQTLWPAKLSCDYSFNQIPLATGSTADWLMAAGVLAAAIGAGCWLWRVHRVSFFLLCFAFLNFLPASNLLFSIGTIRADRLLYLPALGLIGCLVLAVDQLARIPRLALAPPLVLALLVAGFAARTYLRNRDWQSERAIAAADLRVSPNSFKLHRLLAAALFESDPSHANLDQVIAEQQKSLAILDAAPSALRPADAYRMAGYYDLLKTRRTPAPELYRRAIQNLERAVSLDARDRQAWLLLSAADLESGDAGRASAPAARAVALDPLNPQVYRQLSGVFLDLNQKQQAAAARILEDAIAALNRGDWPAAAELSERVTGFEAYPAAFFVSAAASLRLDKLAPAEARAREAIRLDPSENMPEARYLLGLILARNRRWREAAELVQQYLAAAPAAADSGLAREQLRQWRLASGNAK